MNEDMPGERWVQSRKTWIKPVVASWIMENFPGVMENHGWYHWDPMTDEPTCHCGQMLPKARLERRGDTQLFLHVVEVVARELMNEEYRKSIANQITAGRVTWESTSDRTCSMDHVVIKTLARKNYE